MTLDGGTVVGALALVFTVLVEVTRRRNAKRDADRKDSSTALESWDELVARHQHDYNRVAAEYEKKRDEHHRCRSTVRAWELWGQQVNRRLDLPPELLEQFERLITGDGG